MALSPEPSCVCSSETIVFVGFSPKEASKSASVKMCYMHFWYNASTTLDNEKAKGFAKTPNISSHAIWTMCLRRSIGVSRSWVYCSVEGETDNWSLHDCHRICGSLFTTTVHILTTSGHVSRDTISKNGL